MKKTKSASRTPDLSVAAADRTLAILDAFAGGERPFTLVELERLTGLFKSVIFRYMISLERRNYVVKLHDGSYKLGPKLMELGHICEKSFDILSIIEPTLDQIAEETGETVSFYIREANNRVCIARRESNHSLKVSIRPGTTRVLDDTATGQVLSQFYESKADDVAKDELFRASSGVGDGFTCSVSMPIFGASGQLKGALTVSGPIGRFDPQNRKMRQRLKSASTALSFKLGYRPCNVRMVRSSES